jgi:FkbM family methyltransferase
MFKLLFSFFIGKSRYQNFWKRLFQLSLSGMNIGSGASVKNSGELLILQNILRERVNHCIVFDVGANVGNYTKYILSIDPLINVYCFEPSSRTFESLKENLSIYTQSPINLYNFGLSENERVSILHSDTENSGFASIYKRRLDHLNIFLDKEEQIVLKTLDTFCSDNGIENIYLLKLDVEGHELSVLKGANNLIKNDKISYLQFEFGGCNIDSRTYFQDLYYLLKPNFKIYRILKDGLYHIENYSELDEIFVTTNYLAINKKLNSGDFKK